LKVIASPPDNKTPLPFLKSARADWLLSSAIFPDVIEDREHERQGKSFAGAAEIHYDYSN
jgi:hypothetical protein